MPQESAAVSSDTQVGGQDNFMSIEPFPHRGNMKRLVKQNETQN